MPKIIVASKNPVKINACKVAFGKMFPEESFEVIGGAIGSGVSDQPLSDEETYQGATNRARNAKAQYPEADYWVGMEGGVESTGKGLEAFAWMIVIRKDGKLGQGRTATFFLPRRAAELIEQGVELGDVDDIIFKTSNSKQKNGSVGLLTGDIIVRETYYEQALILALIPFLNPELY